MKTFTLTALFVGALSTLSLLQACQPGPSTKSVPANQGDTSMAFDMVSKPHVKPVVYQVFTRLFGNTNTTNKPWGTLAENGVGKFSDFTPTALAGIKELGVSHIWYTGVPHHALVNDYSAYGISLDDPDVIKGRAGSPYAVKDYYNVNPDLADDPAARLAEFKALIARTHAQGMKVIIDIVPNHVARAYESTSRPEGVADFGEQDDTSVEYARDNNFYYIPDEDFRVPESADGYRPLGGDSAPLLDNQFTESPAKWTGNGSRLAQPNMHDWYETVKVNYGVRPDGSYDFPVLPEAYRDLSVAEHHAFWLDKDLPDSWYKFHDIVHYWLAMGVDGFRYDMAEMVPVEFWSFLNSSIKVQYPDAFLLAEVYNPKQFRNYIQLGKMDYLYDKVDFYDSLKAVMQGHGDAQSLEQVQANIADIADHMLHFLENHDEQRIAAPEFAGDAAKGKPAMVVSALISRSPTMLYFGQEVGEDGSEEPGFGDPSRTSIFDYIGVPAHQRWMNDGEFDGGQLNAPERSLREYYVKLMDIAAFHPLMGAQYTSLHAINTQNDAYGALHFAFARHDAENLMLVVSNFAEDTSLTTELSLPATLINSLGLSAGEYALRDILEDHSSQLNINADGASFSVNLAPLSSTVLVLNK